MWDAPRIGLIMYKWWWWKWMVTDFLGIWLDDGNVDAADVVSLSLCLQWFRWMCFGVECGLCVGKNMKLFACGTLWTWGSWGGSPSLMAIKEPAETGILRWIFVNDRKTGLWAICASGGLFPPHFCFVFVFCFFPFFFPGTRKSLPFLCNLMALPVR